MSIASSPNTEPPVYEYQESSLKRFFAEVKTQVLTLGDSSIAWLKSLPLYKKLLLVLVGCVLLTGGATFVIYHQYLMDLVVEYSDKWSQYKWSPYILSSIIFLVSFPPLVGFSFTNTVVGAFYGITFKGWFIIAFSSISGSVSAFLLFKYFLKSRAQQLVSANKKFYAFSTILRENNSFWILALIRLCPFPYSLTNGGLAAIPGITVWNFALGSIISSPKLVLYLFIGTKIKDIGETKDTVTKFIDFGSIVATVIFLGLTSYILFTRTRQRLLELEISRDLEANDEINQGFGNSFHGSDLNTDFDIDDDSNNDDERDRLRLD